MSTTYEGKIKSLGRKLKVQSDNLPVSNFLTLLNAATLINRYLDLQLRLDGLNKTELHILNSLTTHGGKMTPTEISKRVLRSKYGVTRAVDKLERDGLVKRELPAGEDRRNREVSITKEGLEIVERILPRRQQVGYTAMSCLDDTQSEQLATILRSLRKHLGNEISKLTSSGRQKHS